MSSAYQESSASSKTLSSSLAWSSVVPSLPSLPGVYSFLDAEGKILYVGKAKNLKNRLHNYVQIKQLSPRIRKMVFLAKTLRYEVLESELEALLIEAELINTHQPAFNILLKDDKTPIYLLITKEDFPRVLKVRKKELIKAQYKNIVLGPFPSTYKLNEVLKIARKIFPWCNNPRNDLDPKSKNDLRPCFYYHIDLCPGACINHISRETYQEQVKELALFLKGKKKNVVQSIKKKMLESAKNEEFELAEKYKNQIELINEVTAHNYKLRPDMILPSFGKGKIETGFIFLQKIVRDHFNLPKNYSLERIEGYDVSNTQGTNPTVSMVVAKNGEASNQDYRLFNINTLNTPNDFAMLQEAITRRQKHPEWGKPNLLVIDGGKGQLKSVLKIWQWREIPVISIAKHPDRLLLPTILPNQKVEYKIVELSENHPTLNLIQQIRNESHRFAQAQHKRMRTKKMLEFDQI